jgi:hypothetical protein
MKILLILLVVFGAPFLAVLIMWVLARANDRPWNH